MEKVEKIVTEKGYTFKIITDDGVFSISFCGNLDLYFNYECKGINIDNESVKKFTITKENYFLYSIFETLYENIKNCHINYLDDELDVELDEENKKQILQRSEELKKELQEREKLNSRRLFQNDKVEWHSDDYDYDESSILLIEKLEEEIVVSFVKGRTDVLDKTFAIRICNSGSRYQPFNILFMQLYRKLIDYMPEYHQIHLEEIMFDMKRTRKKEF